MIEKNSIMVLGLADEFYIEYVENGQVRRIYFPYGVFSTLQLRINEFAADNREQLAGQNDG